jgi:hypothetical protein
VAHNKFLFDSRETGGPVYLTMVLGLTAVVISQRDSGAEFRGILAEAPAKFKKKV